MEHTHGVLNGIHAMLEDLTKAEMSARSYVISGEERQLESYKSTIKNVREQSAVRRKMTVKDPEGRILTLLQ